MFTIWIWSSTVYSGRSGSDGGLYSGGKNSELVDLSSWEGGQVAYRNSRNFTPGCFEHSPFELSHIFIIVYIFLTWMRQNSQLSCFDEKGGKFRLYEDIVDLFYFSKDIWDYVLREKKRDMSREGIYEFTYRLTLTKI